VSERIRFVAVMLRWLRQFFDRRWYERTVASDVIAYYWEGGQPTRHTVRDVSISGAYIEADVQFYVGTFLMLTLQRGADHEDPVACVTIPCEIVRRGPDGMGVKFMLTRREERLGLRQIVDPAIHASPQSRS
jgi:hypothetical protein